MRQTLTRPSLVRALQLAIAFTIVSSAVAAGAILSWVPAGRALRWVGLFALAGLALAAWRRRGSGRLAAAPVAAAAAFVSIALASTAWSPFPRLTFERGVSFAVMLVAAAALAAAAVDARAILAGIFTGVVVVAVAGLLVLAFQTDRAIQAATTEEAARYQGFGGNPNTVSMLCAIALPLAALYLFEARSRGARIAAAAVVLLLAASIAASASRGALLAGFAGLLVFAIVAIERRRARAWSLAAIAAAFGVCVVVSELPSPKPDSSSSSVSEAATAPQSKYLDAQQQWRLEDEIGRPAYGVAEQTPPRTLFSSSGRAQAWRGGVTRSGERPVAGFGFGTEGRVYVDRYARSGSESPENSYIGVALQLGVVGAVVFLALCIALVRESLRAVRTSSGLRRRTAAACAGVFAAGLLLGLAQSYLYSVGNVATMSVWIAGFLTAGLAAEHA